MVSAVNKLVTEVFQAMGVDSKSTIILTSVAVMIIIAALYLGLFFIFAKINKRVFSKLKEKRGNSVTYQFIENVIFVGLVVYFIVIPLGGDKVARSLLGSTAVVAAIVGFAAQDVIKDMCAGLQLSVYKPFDVGSRIQLEDGTQAIVESLTLRHVVLVLVDTTRLIIPNSKFSSMSIINYSYNDVPRSILMKFPISYESDVDKAKQIIRDIVFNSPLTLNNEKFGSVDPENRDVYFLELGNSALILGVTVYYAPGTRTEILKDSINSSVFKALNENGIEIPYEHVSVVMKPGH